MGKGPSYSEQEIKFILDNYKKIGKVKVAEYLGRSPAGIKRMYYLMIKAKREKEILNKLQPTYSKLEIGKKYRIIIPAEQRGSGVKHRMFTGTVIQVTAKFTVFQLKNYRESFLNWDLERAEIKEV